MNEDLVVMITSHIRLGDLQMKVPGSIQLNWGSRNMSNSHWMPVIWRQGASVSVPKKLTPQQFGLSNRHGDGGATGWPQGCIKMASGNQLDTAWRLVQSSDQKLGSVTHGLGTVVWIRSCGNQKWSFQQQSLTLPESIKQTWYKWQDTMVPTPFKMYTVCLKENDILWTSMIYSSCKLCIYNLSSSLMGHWTSQKDARKPHAVTRTVPVLTRCPASPCPGCCEPGCLGSSAVARAVYLASTALVHDRSLCGCHSLCRSLDGERIWKNCIELYCI